MRRASFALVLAAFAAGCGFKATQPADLGTGTDLYDPGPAGLQGAGALTDAAVDLTSVGTRDWIHWGYLGLEMIDRKASGHGLITTDTEIGTANVGGYANNTVSYAWSDGDVHPRLDGTTSGIYVIGAGNGFFFTVPAGTAPQTLEVYVGGYQSRGQLHAELSGGAGGGAASFDDSSFSRDDSVPYNATYTLRFRTTSDGQTLTVKWTAQSLTAGSSGGNVTLQAAALR
jgi:hypothetical protein